MKPKKIYLKELIRKMVYYAVARGNKTGIFQNWVFCKDAIDGFPDACFKKFEIQEEAQKFIDENSGGKKLPISTSRKTYLKNQFDVDVEQFVYTDGACINNGRPDAVAGMGIYFGENDKRNVSRRVDSNMRQTNNVAELLAILEVYNILEKDILEGKKIAIVSDSDYSLRCVTSFGAKCAADKWSKEIPNKELVKRIYETFLDKSNVQFIHIEAHTDKKDVHSLGNAVADSLANNSVGINAFDDAKPSQINVVKRIYLDVKFEEKDEAKKLGAKWDPGFKKWFVYEGASNFVDLCARFGKKEV